jgi:hypothetical protein
MDPRWEKRTKHGQDLVGNSKRGHKAIVTRPLPPPHHPSHSSEEEEEPEAIKIHSPQVHTNRIVINYSKKTKQETIYGNCGALVYSNNQQCIDRWFWSFFHADWYHSIYLHNIPSLEEARG